jgi:hypothetical protein
MKVGGDAQGVCECGEEKRRMAEQMSRKAGPETGNRNFGVGVCGSPRALSPATRYELLYLYGNYCNESN